MLAHMLQAHFLIFFNKAKAAENEREGNGKSRENHKEYCQNQQKFPPRKSDC